MAVRSDDWGTTWTMAEFIAQVTFDDLPPDVRGHAKRYILDSIANQIGGARIVPGKIILEMFEEMGGKPGSTILATGKRVPCLHATYVNSALNWVGYFPPLWQPRVTWATGVSSMAPRVFGSWPAPTSVTSNG